jgi:hypothetical protein
VGNVVPLCWQGQEGSAAGQPVTVGIPFPQGKVRDAAAVTLADATGELLLQKQPLARWPDGSVKWLLLDFLTPTSVEQLALGLAAGGEAPLPGGTASPQAAETGRFCLTLKELPDALVLDTGSAVFRVNRRRLLLEQVTLDSVDLLQAGGSGIQLLDARGRVQHATIETVAIETRGPVRATIRLAGKFPGRKAIRFLARLSFFAGSGLVRLDVTIHNPKRARHPGGLWDLGDPGSILFKDLSLQLPLRSAPDSELSWVAEAGQQVRSCPPGNFELYQDSSGGENWDSRNHINRAGRVPCTFRGYRLRCSGHQEKGLRASPVVDLQNQHGGVTVGIPDFWQQFPKALEVEGHTLQVRLFPHQCNDLFELQGGEQKTHTVWLDFHRPGATACEQLRWIHQPASFAASPEWYAASKAIPWFTPAAVLDTPLDDLLDEAVHGANNLLARREIIDEYGWRHFGDVYADHENAYYDGPKPIISHYNNQYDVIFGGLLHFLRTGNLFWRALFAPLARHVIDIDLYHTDQDRAAYNGGLFWHTDHYRAAATCTHRCYSRANQKPGQPYGGGPCDEHNYTTGLLHYWYLTGDPSARDAVLSLANWVINLDDGSQTIFGIVDGGPTGQASCTAQPDYQGPGRGCGNSINALLDGWLLTRERRYLEKAEQLIQRVIHPREDIAARNLLEVEVRWSYTVFLMVLGRYLHLKAEAGELDRMHAYARASLLHYATWMVEHEAPYFDHPEKLEFPTETWAAQELRKANVLRLAAVHAGKSQRCRFLERADEIAERAWADLNRFEQPATTRALAILLVEGLRESYFRHHDPEMPVSPATECEFGLPAPFLSQRTRALAQLKTASGLGRAILKLLDVRRWPRMIRLVRRSR